MAARVTTRPAEVETTSAGIWLTSPSPTVSSMYTNAASATVIPCCITPITRPPIRLMNMMMMLAMASPRTNLLAPSIAP